MRTIFRKRRTNTIHSLTYVHVCLVKFRLSAYVSGTLPYALSLSGAFQAFHRLNILRKPPCTKCSRIIRLGTVRRPCRHSTSFVSRERHRNNFSSARYFSCAVSISTVHGKRFSSLELFNKPRSRISVVLRPLFVSFIICLYSYWP